MSEYSSILYCDHAIEEVLRMLFEKAFRIIRDSKRLGVSYPMECALTDIENGLKDLEPNYERIREEAEEWHTQNVQRLAHYPKIDPIQ